MTRTPSDCRTCDWWSRKRRDCDHPTPRLCAPDRQPGDDAASLQGWRDLAGVVGWTEAEPPPARVALPCPGWRRRMLGTA